MTPRLRRLPFLKEREKKEKCKDEREEEKGNRKKG